MSKQRIVVMAGEGGHHTQLLRFINLMPTSVEPLLVTEQEVLDVSNNSVYVCSNRVSNSSKSMGYSAKLTLCLELTKLFFLSLKLLLKNKPNGVVLFGPLFCVPMLLAAKLCRTRVVYIESWSKFEQRSKTGSLAEAIGAQVVYQNIELQGMYREGLYGGRL